MRAALIALALAITPAALALAPSAANAAGLAVPLDQAVRVSLSGAAQDVIVGNPAVAEVNIADPRHLVVTGKSSGVTNIIVTDARGRTIYNRTVVVNASYGNVVTMTAGATSTDFACAPGCQSTTDKSIEVTGALYAAAHPPGTNGQSSGPPPATPATTNP